MVSEQINDNLDDYDKIFSESKSISQRQNEVEIKLLFQLATSGMMIHMSNTCSSPQSQEWMTL